MLARRLTPSQAASEIRRMLRKGGTTEHAEGVQWFFKDEIQSHGWYTAPLRKAAVQTRRNLLREYGMDFVIRVADKLFTGRVLEEKVFAVFLLEKQTDNFGDTEFGVFASWLDRVSSWADHDALVHDLIAPMVVAEPSRSQEIFQWAKSPNRWRRRAACVSLVRATRERKLFPQIVRLSNQLLTDDDDMVQKGLGWLLRETAKADARAAIPYLTEIRAKAPRLVLRTACEKLTAAQRAKILNSRKALD
jgi:3-methyladenine DNA glycosylase AlkD